MADAHAAAAARVAREEAEAGRAAVDCIVPLTHQDLADDVALAATGAYPVVLGGHDHELFVTEEGTPGGRAVKAGQNATKLAVIDLMWKAGAPSPGPPTSVAIEIAEVKKYEGAEDAAVAKAVARWSRPLRMLASVAIGRLPDVPATATATAPAAAAGEGEEVAPPPLSTKNIRRGPSAMASFYLSIMRDCEDVDACLYRSGSIRGDRDYTGETISFGDVMAEFPFGDPNIAVLLTGIKLAELIVSSHEPWVAPNGPEEASGAYQMDDKCVVAHENGRTELLEVGGEPFDPSRLYSVLLSDYDFKAGELLKQWAVDHPEYVPPGDTGRPTVPIIMGRFSYELWNRLADVDESGHVDAGEIRRLFDGAGGEGADKLSFDQVKAALKARVGAAGSELLAKELFHLADENDDGAVSRAELERVLLEHAYGD